MSHANCLFLCMSEDPSQVGRGIALITVMDINDNAPVFAIEYETLLCENAAPGQVCVALFVFINGVKMQRGITTVIKKKIVLTMEFNN